MMLKYGHGVMANKADWAMVMNDLAPSLLLWISPGIPKVFVRIFPVGYITQPLLFGKRREKKTVAVLSIVLE
jgi:hypothetical protein